MGPAGPVGSVGPVGPPGPQGVSGPAGPPADNYYALKNALFDNSMEFGKNPATPWCGETDRCVLPLGSKGFMSTETMLLDAPTTMIPFNQNFCFGSPNACFRAETDGEVCLHYGPSQKSFSFCFQRDGNVVKYRQDGLDTRRAVWSTGLN